MGAASAVRLQRSLLRLMPNPTYGELAAAKRDLKGKAKAAADLEAWHRSAEGVAAYKAALDEAQRRANELGMDHGLAFAGCIHNGRIVYGGWHSWALPAKQHRFGADHTCAVIHPIDLEKTRKGHGPRATRPPSLVGPDYHGGPFDSEKNLAAYKAWVAEHGPLYPEPTPEQRAAEAAYVAKLDRHRYGLPEPAAPASASSSARRRRRRRARRG